MMRLWDDFVSPNIEYLTMPQVKGLADCIKLGS